MINPMPQWARISLLIGLGLIIWAVLMPLAGAQTVTTIKVRYTWVAPTTRLSGVPLALSEIAGYQLALTSQPTPVSIAGHLTSYEKDYPVGADGCVRDSASMVARDTNGLTSPMSNVVNLVLCPPSKIELRWTATVIMAPVTP